MAITYDTLGSTVTVHPTGTVAPGQLNTAVAIVGGMDVGSGNANTDEVTIVNTGTEADNEFGSGSELAIQAKLAFANGATAVHGVPLAETQTTENFTSASSGTLSNTPVFDPNVQAEHNITAQDVTNNNSVTVNIVYADSPSQPSGPDEMNLNPRNGNWAADESVEYDITYTYGDFGSAISTAVGETVRAVGVCTEAAGPKSTLDTDMATAETNFRFLRGFTGTRVDISTGSTGSFTPDTDDWRMVEIAPSRGTHADGSARTVGAVLGLAASQPINVTGSITYDTISGLTDLRTKFSPTQAENFSRVTAVTDEYEIAQGSTTSSESTWQDIYKVEIVDFVVEGIYARIKTYRGGSNAQRAKTMFEERLRRLLSSYAAPNASPPLLASGDGSTPYSVTVGAGSTDTEADVDIGIDVAPIAKEVVLDISVGPIQFSGASV